MKLKSNGRIKDQEDFFDFTAPFIENLKWTDFTFPEWRS
jgi:hypothetical protein